MMATAGRSACGACGVSLIFGEDPAATTAESNPAQDDSGAAAAAGAGRSGSSHEGSVSASSAGPVGTPDLLSPPGRSLAASGEHVAAGDLSLSRGDPEDAQGNEGRAIRRDIVTAVPRVPEGSFLVVAPPRVGIPERDGGRRPQAASAAAVARVLESASQPCGDDFPLCSSCMSAAESAADAAVAAAQCDLESARAEEEDDGRAAAHAEADAASGADAGGWSDAALDDAEAALRARVASSCAALAAARAESTTAVAASAAADAAESAYWTQLAAHEHVTEAMRSRTEALAARAATAESSLLSLRRAHALNEAFFIWHAGPFGTISGLRLGRTADCPVDWDEINAAWGHAVLLLHAVGTQLGLTYAPYSPRPMGSHARVAHAGAEYELWGPVSLFRQARYDRAQVGALACLKQASDFLAGGGGAGAPPLPEGRCPLPYPIDGDKVGGRTIRLAFNREERWTAALQYFLSDLKSLLSRLPPAAAS